MNYKKLLILLIFSILFIPNVFASDDISIKSIILESKSDTTTIKSEPTFNGLEMNYSLGFENVNDYAKYIIEIENNTDKDYVITKGTSFKLSDYVEYRYTSDQMIKHNNRSIVKVHIEYIKEVEDGLFQNEKYTESNKAILQILDDNNQTVVNPKTGESYIKIVLIIVVILLSIVVGFVLKNKSLSLVILLFVCLVPTLLDAYEELKLTINVDVTIEKNYSISYLIQSHTYIKSDEIKKYNTSGSNCNTIVYVDSVDENNKYYYCENNYIYTDAKRYRVGQRVNLEGLYVTKILCTLSDDNMISSNEYLCTNDSQEDIVLKIQFNNLGYRCNDIPNNYVCYNNDKDTMSFSSILYDAWNEEKRLDIMCPNEFTMPSHNVLFAATLEDN